jgi:Fe2+ transport system protein FeoA
MNIGHEYKIISLSGDPLLQSRLQELGFFVGQNIKLISRAPFKGPYLVQVEGIVLALREYELSCLKCEAL